MGPKKNTKILEEKKSNEPAKNVKTDSAQNETGKKKREVKFESKQG